MKIKWNNWLRQKRIAFKFSNHCIIDWISKTHRKLYELQKHLRYGNHFKVLSTLEQLLPTSSDNRSTNLKHKVEWYRDNIIVLQHKPWNELTWEGNSLLGACIHKENVADAKTSGVILLSPCTSFRMFWTRACQRRLKTSRHQPWVVRFPCC